MKRSKLINPHIIAVIENEWAQMARNRVIVLTTFAPPFLFVALALSILYLSTWIDGGDVSLSEMRSSLAQNAPSGTPELSEADAVRAALLSPFLVLFEMLPIVVPLTIASYSIIGEKQTRSLEALLATPIRTWELLVAKALAASIPGLGATWYAFAIFVFAARFTVSPAVYEGLILSPAWVSAITVLTPIFTLFAVSMGIIISSKVKDPHSAQQLASLVILPMVGIMVGQVLGAVDVSVALIAGTALLVGLADILLMVLAVRLFQRETILTSWR